MFETERLLLRPMTAADVGPVFAMRSDPAVMRYIRSARITRAEAEKWIDLVSSRWTTERIGFCAVIEKDSGRFAGWCGLWRLVETGETEIGYALFPAFWGRGYAPEAARAVLRYGFEKLGLERLVAVADPLNAASRRVMEKIGMRFDYVGEFYGRDLVHYSISREEYEKESPPAE